MKMLQEFKEFAFRGNLIDLAVGVVIGGAFGKLVSSLVENLIMPPLSYLTPSSSNLKQLKFILKRAQVQGDESQAEVAVNYGVFLEHVLDFLIISFAIFVVIKFVNKFHKKQENKEAPKEESAQERILIQIRDLLKSQKQESKA